MKNLKKFSIIIFVILILLSTSVFAATVSSEKAKLELVENNVCTIKVTDTVNFEKKIIDYNLEKKELTLGLNISNTADPLSNLPLEVVLVIDNSYSMTENEVVEGVTRLKSVTDSAKKLANKLLEKENISLGVVSFSTGKVEGTIDDANLRTELTKDSTKILSAIDEIATDKTQGPRTNIDAGLQVANSCFTTQENNKYVILLTDGVPNTAIGGPTFTYSGDVATKTKATLTNLKEKGINIISAMIGLSETTVEPSTEMTYKALSEEIFGTVEKPFVGKFYYVSDKDIEKSICETIFSNIVDINANTLTNIDIYDYFPQEIVDNFDFKYVTSPNLGNVSTTIDTTNNSIVWHIDELKPQTKGSLSYKLTLKPNIDSSIINVVLNTNKKVDITANEVKTNDGSNVLSSTVSPKVRVTLPKDTTVANNTIPQTGSTPTPIIFISLVSIGCAIIGIRFYLINRDVK